MSLPLLKPMLAVSSAPFDSGDYLFEIKWDGYRGLLYLDDTTQIRSRNLQDLTAVFPELGGIHRQVGRLPAILDGEIIVLDKGMPSFDALQSRGRTNDAVRIKQAALKLPAVFVAFDVLYAAGEPVMNLPLLERKEILAAMVKAENNLLLSQFVTERGVDFYRACVEKDLEGVVAKRLDSVYLPGKRSHSWKKIRRVKSADLVICGYEGARQSDDLRAIIVADFSQGRLTYRGKVGTGFSFREKQRLTELLKPLETAAPPFKVPPKKDLHNPKWVAPRYVCEVHYSELTADGRLRHASFKGLRPDKDVKECRLEK